MEYFIKNNYCKEVILEPWQYYFFTHFVAAEKPKHIITVYSVGALIDQLEEANECFRKNFFIKIATSKIPLEYPNLSLNTADYSILELAIKYYETKEDILISNNRIKAYYKMFNSILYSAVLLRLKAINSTATDKEYKELCTFVSYFFVNLRKEYG